MYVRGKLLTSTMPTIIIYRLILPVACSAVINVPENIFIAVIYNVHLTKETVYSGTSISHKFRMYSVSRQMGIRKNKQRKNENLAPLNTNLCISANSPAA